MPFRVGETDYDIHMIEEKFDHGRCPYCATRLDGSSSVSKDGTVHMPSPRNFTICTECGNILQYDADLRVRKPKEEDLEQMKANQPDDYRMLKAMSLLWSKSVFTGKLRTK